MQALRAFVLVTCIVAAGACSLVSESDDLVEGPYGLTDAAGPDADGDADRP